MKNVIKKRMLIVGLILYLFLFCACNDVSQTVGMSGKQSDKSDIPYQTVQMYAVAYLGYQTIDDLDYYVEHYLEDDQLPIYHVSDGDYYLIIPRYADMSLSLYVNEIENDEKRLVFEDPVCEPFLLQCNASDVFADATIVLTREGESVSYTPFISLKDGTLVLDEHSLDITKNTGAGGAEQE